MLFSYEKWKAEWILGCRIAAVKLAQSKLPSHHPEKNKKQNHQHQ